VLLLRQQLARCLAEISVPFEMVTDFNGSEVKGQQRNLDPEHAEPIKRYLEKGVVIATKGLTKSEEWKMFGKGELKVFKNWEMLFRIEKLSKVDGFWQIRLSSG